MNGCDVLASETFAPLQPRQSLKQATDSVHQSLHVHPVALAMLNTGSGTALQTFLRAQLSLLMQLDRAMPVAFRDQYDGLRDALRSDINENGPLDGRPNATQTRAHMAGTSYVALGSLMGRKTILNAMRRHHTTRFPDDYLKHPMPIAWWQWTLSELDVLAPQRSHWAAVEASALAGFAHIRSCLDAGWQGANP